MLDHIAKILHTNQEIFERTIKKMEEITGKKNVTENIVQENKEMIQKTFEMLHIKNGNYEEIQQRIYDKLIGDDHVLYHFFDEPDLTSAKKYKKMIDTARKYGNHEKGFFLKKEKALELLLKTPPPHIMHACSCNNVQQLLNTEDWREIFAALRFVETREWMNNIFLPQYKSLKPSDFEQREASVIVLAPKWLKIAEKFIEKKYHNVSHLKELGIIFIIPLPIDTPGETLVVFSLLLHYFYEVQFYSRLITRYAQDENTFNEKLISLLRGDVSEVLPFTDHKIQWLIVQRYLAKDNPNDPRLFQPHVNSETIHWDHANEYLSNFARDNSLEDLEFWAKLHYIGDFFKKATGEEKLLSFNLVDSSIALVKRETIAKYIYHHQESLWNRIFKGFIEPEKKLEDLIVENFDRGVIQI